MKYKRKKERLVIYRHKEPSNYVSHEKSMERAALAFELSAKGYTQRQIADEIEKAGLGHITQPAVYKMLKRMEKLAIEMLDVEGLRARQEHSLRCMFKESYLAWNDSRQPDETGKPGPGNLECLRVAAEYLDRIGKLFALNAPEIKETNPVQVQVNNITPSHSLSEMIQIAAEIEAKKMYNPIALPAPAPVNEAEIEQSSIEELSKQAGIVPRG